MSAATAPPPPPPLDAASLTRADVARARQLLACAKYRREIERDPSCDRAAKSAKDGIWILQCNSGKEFACSEPRSQGEQSIFGAAVQMKNLIYLVGDVATRECYCIDAAWDTDGIAKVAAEHKMVLVGAIATHSHWDHNGGILDGTPYLAMVHGPFAKPGTRMPGIYEMMKTHGCVGYVHTLDAEALARVIRVAKDDFALLEHGQRLPLGASGHQFEVLHTPGHSTGSICLLIWPSGAKTPQAIITGDTLFPGSVGRLDGTRQACETMYDSLRKLDKLDGKITVYPGHNYSPRLTTTIEREKNGGMLQWCTKQHFVSMMGGG